MRAVLDSSTALASVLPEPLKPKAIQFLDEFRSGLHDLLAPDIFPIETLNGLAKAERQKRIKQAYSLWQGIMSDCPVLHPHFVLLTRAHEISDEERRQLLAEACRHMAKRKAFRMRPDAE